MFEKIKNFFLGAAKFVYAVTVEPIVNLRHFFSMSTMEKVISALDAVSRVIIIASFFTAVPAFLVALAWTWVIGITLVAIVWVSFVVGTAIAAMKGIADVAEERAATNDIGPMPVAA